MNQLYSMDKRVAKEINLKDLYRVIKKRFWIVIVITIIMAFAGWYYGIANKPLPLYESSANIIIMADGNYRNTLQVIIKDPIVLENVIDKLDLEKSADTLAEQIYVSSIDESQVVNISVTDTDPERAVEIANMTAKVFIGQIPKIIDFEDARILSEAKVKPFQINEINQNKFVVIAIILGLVIGVGLIFVIDSLDDSIKSERDIEDLLMMNMLGSVSVKNKKNVKKRKKKRNEIEHRGEDVVTDWKKTIG